jgi:hypothetical protein
MVTKEAIFTKRIHFRQDSIFHPENNNIIRVPSGPSKEDVAEDIAGCKRQLETTTLSYDKIKDLPFFSPKEFIGEVKLLKRKIRILEGKEEVKDRPIDENRLFLLRVHNFFLRQLASERPVIINKSAVVDQLNSVKNALDNYKKIEPIRS